MVSMNELFRVFFTLNYNYFAFFILLRASPHTMENREKHENSDDSDIGPSLPDKPVKKRKLRHENLLLQALPNYSRYTRSYRHRDELTSVTVGPEDSGIVVTGSNDGYIKFWSCVSGGDVEFVKQFHVYDRKPVTETVFSLDGALLATISQDRTSKVFDVKNFDMISVLQFNFIPLTACFARHWSGAEQVLIVADSQTPTIYVFDPQSESNDPIAKISGLHKGAVEILAYNKVWNCIVSSDSLGMVEYWELTEDGHKKPDGVFEMKSSTNLYDYRKTKTLPRSISISKDGKKFVVASSDRKIAIFDFRTGKKIREYDESVKAAEEMQRFGTSLYKSDGVEFARRIEFERVFEAQEGLQRLQNVIFDQSGNFILFPTVIGIKLTNTITNTTALLFGADENLRFVHLSLYQGLPDKKGVMTMEMAAADNELISKSLINYPILFATAVGKNRFYMFTRYEGEFSTIRSSRDVFNDEIKDSNVVREATVKKPVLGSKVTLHTSMGDIVIKLFGEYAPLAVENFTTHCKNGYYDNLIFHRVIKKFMIQGGDPNGDGTGGRSIWGKNFEDEFTPHLRHDVPFTVSMANAGRNTNGSQFFITTEKTPWLDDKHTIFGRVVSGMEVVKSIEGLKTNKDDVPEDPARIVSTSVEG